MFAFQSEGSELRSMGSVAIGDDAYWSAELTVPIGGDPAALLIVERHDARDDASAQHAALVVPQDEIDAVLALLTGIVTQARRDGVLAAPVSDPAPGEEIASDRQ